MSLRLLMRLAKLSVQRRAVRLAEAEHARMAAADKLASLQDKATLRQKPEQMTMTTDPLWHLRLGEEIDAAHRDLAQADDAVAATREPLQSAHAEKMRYETLLEARRQRELKRLADIEQRDLDETGRRA